ncbi:ABATE domain-containing protein [Actinomadura terrae]|uniref:ABATE domain-containing protein n=1 Tax=Actinomadura terrae TaxID=604353 RepID=UPI001FA760CE|nr:ABATE domain-containing protein [Actinomadura terrae]
MDLASYADLAVDLVNTHQPHRDELRDLEGLRALLLRRPYLGGRTARRDLDAMRELRAELRAVFVSAARGDELDAIERLNTLLIRYPVHPTLTRHDGQGWHLHLNEDGSVPDRVAARAAMGLAARIGSRGIGALGVCRVEGCERVYLTAATSRTPRYCCDLCGGGATGPASGSHPGVPLMAIRRPARDGGQ